MKILLVGPDGLVGSAFARHFEAAGVSYQPVRRADMHTVAGAQCDLLIGCYGNANKGWAGEHPALDFGASLGAVAHYTHAVRAGLTVHISTIDVYPDAGNFEATGESAVIDPLELSPYGFHKYLAELYVRRYAPRHLILRVPGLVGPGLKKNPVFDHFTPGRKLFVSGASRLNFLHTDDIARHALAMVNAGIEGTFNLGATNSIEIGNLSSISGCPCVYHEGADANLQTYRFDVRRVAQIVDLCSSEEAIERYAASLAWAPACNRPRSA